MLQPSDRVSQQSGTGQKRVWTWKEGQTGRWTVMWVWHQWDHWHLRWGWPCRRKTRQDTPTVTKGKWVQDLGCRCKQDQTRTEARNPGAEARSPGTSPSPTLKWHRLELGGPFQFPKLFTHSLSYELQNQSARIEESNWIISIWFTGQERG